MSFGIRCCRKAAVSPPQKRAASCPPMDRKEGCPMVTYSDLIQIGILIVGIISLFLQIKKK